MPERVWISRRLLLILNVVTLIIFHMEQISQNRDPELESDYQLIRKDLKRVILGNLFFLALLVGLYFADQKYAILSHLEKLF